MRDIQIKSLSEEIQQYMNSGKIGLASILKQHHNDKWDDGVTLEEFMSEDDQDYADWLKQQNY